MGPLVNDLFLACKIGVILTNLTKWDDPPSGGGRFL